MVEAFRGSKVSNYSYSEPRQFKFWMGASSREQSCGLTQPLAMKRGSWWITIVRQYFGAGKGPFQFLKGFLVRKIHCSYQGSHVCFSEASGRPISPLCIPFCACSWASRGRLEITAVKNKAESMIGSHLTHILKVKMDAHTGKKTNKIKFKTLSPQLRAD